MEKLDARPLWPLDLAALAAAVITFAIVCGFG